MEFLVKITILRIKGPEQEPNLFYYHIRHSDSDWGKPISVEKHVLVNHFGTLVSTVSLDFLFEKKEYYTLKPCQRNVIYNNDNFEFFDGNELFELKK